MSLKQELELLRRVPIFAEIEPTRLKLLAFVSERVGFDPGKQLMRQKDCADAAYVIIDGHVDIVLETPAGQFTVATLGANSIVGDMGILGNATRAATVRAKDRVIALRIAKETFMHIVLEFPSIAVSIIQELAQQLESTNMQLSNALAEVKRLRSDVDVTA